MNLTDEDWQDCFRLLGLNAGAVPEIGPILENAKELQRRLGLPPSDELPLMRLSKLLKMAQERIAVREARGK